MLQNAKHDLVQHFLLHTLANKGMMCWFDAACAAGLRHHFAFMKLVSKHGSMSSCVRQPGQYLSSVLFKASKRVCLRRRCQIPQLDAAIPTGRRKNVFILLCMSSDSHHALCSHLQILCCNALTQMQCCICPASKVPHFTCRSAACKAHLAPCTIIETVLGVKCSNLD